MNVCPNCYPDYAKHEQKTGGILPCDFCGRWEPPSKHILPINEKAVSKKVWDRLKEQIDALAQSPFKEIRAASRRAVAMGKHIGWQPEFNSHPLAASIDNHTACIDVELNEPQPDYLAVLYWILNMARTINRYCDNNKIEGDKGAQYWLERFVWVRNTVADMEKLA